jgi:hypothetical protein
VYVCVRVVSGDNFLKIHTHMRKSDLVASVKFVTRGSQYIYINYGRSFSLRVGFGGAKYIAYPERRKI